MKILVTAVAITALLTAACEVPSHGPRRVVCYSGGVVIFDEVLVFTTRQGMWVWQNEAGEVIQLPSSGCVHRFSAEAK